MSQTIETLLETAGLLLVSTSQIPASDHEPDITQTHNFYTVNGDKIETVLLADLHVHRHYRQIGKTLIRSSTRRPSTSQDDQWHGPYDTEALAVADFISRTKRPIVTRAEYTRRLKDDIAGDFAGQPSIVHLDRWTGSTVLTIAEIR